MERNRQLLSLMLAKNQTQTASKIRQKKRPPTKRPTAIRKTKCIFHYTRRKDENATMTDFDYKALDRLKADMSRIAIEHYEKGFNKPKEFGIYFRT